MTITFVRVWSKNGPSHGVQAFDFDSINDVRAKEFVHLLIAINAFREAILAHLGRDQYFVRYRVEQIPELLFLHLGYFDFQKEVGLYSVSDICNNLNH